MTLPKGCRLIGIELLDEAAPLPSFKHPLRAAYQLGPEKGGLSAEITDAIVKIPTKFCVNLGIAGAIVMYDRHLTLGRFGERPLHEGAPPQARASQTQEEFIQDARPNNPFASMQPDHCTRLSACVESRGALVFNALLTIVLP